MHRALKDVLPLPEVLLKLEPEEIAVFLLDYLCEIDETGKNPLERSGKLNRYNFTLEGNMS